MAGLGPERPREQRKMKRWRRRDLNTNLLEVRGVWWLGRVSGTLSHISMRLRDDHVALSRGWHCQPVRPPSPPHPGQVCRELRPRDLQALLLDAAVWLCCDDDVVYKLDTLCFGNLDGGAGTAAYVRQHLEAAGRPVQGDKAVRLSLDEAFFMAYALGILTVHELEPAGSGAAGSSAGGSGAVAGVAAGAAAGAAAEAGAAEQQPDAAVTLAAAGAGGAAEPAPAPAGEAAALTEPTAAAAAAGAGPAPAPEAPGEAGLVAVPLDSGALWRRLQQQRPDFFLLYLAYHHFRSKVG